MRTSPKHVLASTAIAAVFAGIGAASAAAEPLAFTPTNVGSYGGEPSLVSDPSGLLYESSLASGTSTWKSLDKGKTWTPTTTADGSSGDDCLASDQAGSIYLCNLAGSPGTAPLQADAWKTVDGGKTWTYGNGIGTQTPAGNLCSTSCNPFGVDRDWMDAWIPPGGDTNSARVLLMYHDFYGPSSIWVNLSQDGGATYSNSQDVFANFTPNASAQQAEATAYNACSTVPIGAGIAKSGPHTGREFVAWIASDPESFATGCNESQAQAFHTIWIAYSDDNGATWTPQMAYDAGPGHDTSTPFASFELDNQGNPYVAFATQAPNANPAVCSAEGTAGKVQADSSCAYHMWVVWSANGGSVWDGGGGLIPGSAAHAYEVDPGNAPQTDVFPAMAVGDPGKIDVFWLGTNEIAPTDPNGKFHPGACAGPATSHVSTFPPTCNWDLYAAQSLNVSAPIVNAKWQITKITSTPMHVGDICNLGIACIPGVSNRNLSDFIMAAVDPTTGMAHIAYADDNKVRKTRVANQTSGEPIITDPDRRAARR